MNARDAKSENESNVAHDCTDDNIEDYADDHADTEIVFMSEIALT